VPTNLSFVIDDVEEEWLYSHKFDFIHARLMAGSLKDWQGVVDSAFEFATFAAADDDVVADFDLGGLNLAAGSSCKIICYRANATMTRTRTRTWPDGISPCSKPPRLASGQWTKRSTTRST